jgi:hypothetical protein
MAWRKPIQIPMQNAQGHGNPTNVWILETYFTIYNLESTITQQIINVHIAHNSTSPSQSSNFQNSRLQAHCSCFVAPKSTLHNGNKL